MPFIPKAICVKCQVPYKVEKNGVVIHAYSNGSYYYSIHTDKWKCPGCGHKIIRGFADCPFNMNWQSDGEEPSMPRHLEILRVNL